MSAWWLAVLYMTPRVNKSVAFVSRHRRVGFTFYADLHMKCMWMLVKEPRRKVEKVVKEEVALCVDQYLKLNVDGRVAGQVSVGR